MIQLELTQLEAQQLIECLNIVTKSMGNQAARVTLLLEDKILAAMAAQQAVATTGETDG